jgi:hypothetical protein
MLTDSPATLVQVKIIPRSSKNQVAGYDRGCYKIKIAAPPVDGQANQGLIAFLAKKLGIAKSRVKIVSGEKSKQKKIKIDGLTLSEIRTLLEK